MFSNSDEVLRYIKDEDVVFVDVRFCDLPGYGYAKVSKAERDRWAAMIEDYLRGRDVLQAVVLIVDARHAPREIQEEAFRRGMIPYLP